MRVIQGHVRATFYRLRNYFSSQRNRPWQFWSLWAFLFFCCILMIIKVVYYTFYILMLMCHLIQTVAVFLVSLPIKLVHYIFNPVQGTLIIVTVVLVFALFVMVTSHGRTIGNNKCVICLNAHADYLLVPCGHLCACQICVQQLRSRGSCPICRSYIQSTTKVYVP